jgi:hypothetical protein
MNAIMIRLYVHPPTTKIGVERDDVQEGRFALQRRGLGRSAIDCDD